MATSTQSGVQIVPESTVNGIAIQAGLSASDAATLTSLYTDSQVSSLRISFVALLFISALSLLFSKHIPTELVRRKTTEGPEDDRAHSDTA